MLGLGLTTTRGMSRGRAPTWTPARLFSDGQQGVWYEPKPEYLFQDAAGTIAVTADGDPVGLMLDLSPNGRDASALSSARRPLSGAVGLGYDGVDDLLVSTDANALPVAGVSSFVLLKSASDKLRGAMLVAEGDTVGSSAQYFLFRPMGSNNSLLSVGSPEQTHAFTAPLSKWFLVEIHATLGASASVEFVLDGVTTSYSKTFADSADFFKRIHLGATVTNTQHWPGEIGASIVVGENLSLEDRQKTREYLANLAGVTL